ncbi:hypothetical protein Droror1_Dr00027973 [Drosera rotundifolia]
MTIIVVMRQPHGANAFVILKQFVQRCLQDAIKFGNVFAEAVLQHLYRWLCSPRSKLHDPALHSMLHKVMQKVFALLLAEFRKLGATIVFANFSKVIIDTGKSDLSAAEAYCDSLLKVIQSRNLFEWIEIEPLNFWHCFLYMDQVCLFPEHIIHLQHFESTMSRNAHKVSGL